MTCVCVLFRERRGSPIERCMLVLVDACLFLLYLWHLFGARARDRSNFSCLGGEERSFCVCASNEGRRSEGGRVKSIQRAAHRGVRLRRASTSSRKAEQEGVGVKRYLGIMI